jgi:hypothetical protein
VQTRAFDRSSTDSAANVQNSPDAENSCRSFISSITAGQSMRSQTLLQQFDERRSRLCLPLGGDLSNERLNCTFEQNAQDYVRVHADSTGHADRLSKDVRWVGLVGGDALNSTYECLDGGIRTVWHVAEDGGFGGGGARRSPDVLDLFAGLA